MGTLSSNLFTCWANGSFLSLLFTLHQKKCEYLLPQTAFKLKTIQIIHEMRRIDTQTHTRTRIVLTFSFIETTNIRWTKHTKPRFWIVITSAPMFYWNMRFEVKQTGIQNERPRQHENGTKDGKNTYRFKGNLHHLNIQRTHFIFIKATQLVTYHHITPIIACLTQ